jgi:hypothetical protein
MAGLTGISTEQTARSGASWCGGDGGGDLRRCSVKTRSGRWRQGERALGARSVRRGGRRRSLWTRWGGEEATVAVGFTVAQLRLRRPWWGEARERAGGGSEVSRGSSDTGGGSSWRRDGVRASRQARRWRGERARVAVSLLCLLAEVGDDWRGPDGPAQSVSGLGPFCYFCFPIFYFFCNFVALFKIVRHYQKSPNCSCPLFKI